MERVIYIIIGGLLVIIIEFIWFSLIVGSRADDRTYKSAKEMFEKLGYELFIGSEFISYYNRKKDCHIYFYDDLRIEIRCDVPLDIGVYIAINQQCLESGWLDD